MDCIFCKIIAGDIPSAKVYEDEMVYAFRDINPMAPVHVLIVPKCHVASADEPLLKLVIQSQQQVETEAFLTIRLLQTMEIASLLPLHQTLDIK